MIKLENITKNYRFGGGYYQALKGVNLEIKQGEFICLLGPSGCGKSTLLNITGFLDSPSSGKYIFKNENVSDFSDYKRTVIRRKEIGFIFQSFNLLPRLSALENIILPALYLNTDKKKAVEKAKKIAEQLNISEKMENSILELSGGEKQRVAIARALINSPSVLLADEPTGNLDSKNAVEVVEILKNLNKEENMTILMVTHDISVSKTADRIIKIKDGKIDENF